MSGVSRAANRPAPVTQLEVLDGQDPASVIADWQTIRIRSALGIQFRQTSRVLLRRPRWMPRFIFHELMRSILVDTDGAVSARDLSDVRLGNGTYAEDHR